jgi:hypothetical protein
MPGLDGPAGEKGAKGAPGPPGTYGYKVRTSGQKDLSKSTYIYTQSICKVEVVGMYLVHNAVMK